MAEKHVHEDLDEDHVAREISETPEVHDDEKSTEDDLNTSAEESNTESESDSEPEPEAEPKVHSMHDKQGFWGRVAHHKIWLSVSVVVVLIGILAIVPFTRYKILGLFLKQTVAVQVLDSQTQKPVTNASVMAGGQSVKTDTTGFAHLHVSVGRTKFVISKTYYAPNTVWSLVPVMKPKSNVSVSLQATGRQVPVSVVSLISGQPIEGVTISAAGTDAKTDKSGMATLVLPADKMTVNAAIMGQGFNNKSVSVKVTTTVDAANTFQLTPSGQIYFLSNLNGNIDVAKTNLDGTNRQTVVAGTGNEDRQQTVLLATRDWRFLALLAKRDATSPAKLFLIDTSTDKMTTMDEGNATFNPVGWSGHHFVYSVSRNGVDLWQPNQQALKSFNADSGSGTILDQTTASGSNQNDFNKQTLGAAYVFGSQVVYSMSWSAGYYSISKLASDQDALISINVDGSNKQTLKTFQQPASPSPAAFMNLSTVPYEASGLYIEFSYGSTNQFYTYEDGAVKDNTTLTQDQFYTNYFTYLLSPDGSQTFWTEPRDGKNTLFIGDQNGENKKQIATLSDYNQYGWYTGQYLLVSKNSSELYIMPNGGGNAIKITDYYKPSRSFYGYGSGYGGL